MIDNSRATPIIKWAGGKTKVLKQLITKFPFELHYGKIRNYYEPFFGGGAVFFNIIQNYNIQNCVLSDVNEELMLFYNVVKKDPNKLLSFVEKYQSNYDRLTDSDKEKFYYEIRNTYNIERFNIDFNDYSYLFVPRAAQMLFLNKTCYNGLFRQNLRGEFNVPFGKNYKTNIVDKNNLYKVSKTLENVSLLCTDFQEICEKIEDRDSFVYLDPPYRPINKSARFTNYHMSNFIDNDQFRLAEIFKKLNEKNVKLMLNNSCSNTYDDSGVIENFYKDFQISYINTSSTMSSISSKRKKINELIITNY
ncbi:MAG: modification methylase [Odoribacter sp.]|nr:modification methylase [Odoribacter sp.]